MRLSRLAWSPVLGAIDHPNASKRYGVWAMKTLDRPIARRLRDLSIEPRGQSAEAFGSWWPDGAPPWSTSRPHRSALCPQAFLFAFERAPRPASRCFPSASPTMARGPGKQKAAPKDRSKPLISLRKSGAGEGIRTLDPNLGKIAIRPPVPFFPPNEAAGRNQHSDPYTLLIPCYRFFRNNYTCYNIVL